MSEKDLELATAYNEAVKELEELLMNLKVKAANEADLALKFVNDTTIPIDCLDKLAAKVAYTKAAARRVLAARSAYINHRFNR